MFYKTLVVITLFLAVSSVAAAADVSGTWTAQVPGRNGIRDTKFNFKVDGDKLTGTMSADRQDSPLADGRVSGDTISFTASVGIREGHRLEFRWEAFNFLNTPQFTAPSASFGSATFGRISGTLSNNREMQFALKYRF